MKLSNLSVKIFLVFSFMFYFLLSCNSSKVKSERTEDPKVRTAFENDPNGSAEKKDEISVNKEKEFRIQLIDEVISPGSSFMIAWQSIKGATSYDLRVGTDSRCVSTVLVMFDLVATQQSISLNNEGQYYICVVAKFKDASDVSALNSGLKILVNAIQSDSTTPTSGNSGAIFASSIAENSLTLNWTVGSDDQSTVENLQYEVRQSSSNNINTVADAELYGTIIRSYTANIATINVTLLAVNSTYYFNVIVKDEAGNKSIYLAESVTTLSDTIAPTVGNSGAISVTSIAENSVTLNWTVGSDDQSTASNLQYEVRQSSSNNISTVEDAELNGTIIKSYTANISNFAVPSLVAENTYYFNVLVKDQAGNKSVYIAESATTLSDTIAPTVGNSGAISVTSIAENSVNLNWTMGSDDQSTTSNLHYEVRQSSSNNISTVEDAELNGTIIKSYTANIATFNVTSLVVNSTYYFNVIVKDEAGNKSIYLAESATTLPDTIAPTIGNSGAISVTSIAENNLTLNWTVGSDDQSTTANLQYEVRQSSSNNINTVEDAELNGSIIKSYATNIVAFNVISLAADSSYYFNVIVRDESDNKSIYIAELATTSTPPSAPTEEAQAINFIDTNGFSESVGGDVTITKASDEESLTHYTLYWGTNSSTKRSGSPFIADIAKIGSNLTYTFPANTTIPTSPNATHLLVFTRNGSTEMETGKNIAISDLSEISVTNNSDGSQTLDFQPGPTTGNDAYINASAQTTNYGSGTTFNLGNQIVSGGGWASYPLLSFDMPLLPDKGFVKGATLSLYHSAGSGNGTTMGVSLRELTGIFDQSTATWSNLGGPNYGGTSLGQLTFNENSGSVWRIWGDNNENFVNYIQSQVSSGDKVSLTLVQTSGSNWCGVDFYASEYGANTTLRPKLSINFSKILFVDTDVISNEIAGDVNISKAVDESGISDYVLYWGSDATTKLGSAIESLPATGNNLISTIPGHTAIPSGAAYLLVFIENSGNEIEQYAASAIVDNDIVTVVDNGDGTFTARFQPGPIDGNDTYLYAGDGASINGGSTALSVGNQYVSGGAYATFPYLGFDISSLVSDISITEAIFSLYHYGNGNSQTANYSLRELPVVFNQSTASWNSLGGASFGSTSFGELEFNEASVLNWRVWGSGNSDFATFLGSRLADDGIVNLTLRQTTNNNWIGPSFYSSEYTTDVTLRPKLEITYTMP